MTNFNGIIGLVAPLETGVEVAFSPALENDPLLDDGVECDIDMEDLLRVMEETDTDARIPPCFKLGETSGAARTGKTTGTGDVMYIAMLLDRETNIAILSYVEVVEAAGGGAFTPIGEQVYVEVRDGSSEC